MDAPRFKGIAETRETLIEQGWNAKPSVGFNELVGPIWARRDTPEGEWLNGFIVEPRHLNGNGQLHGGMTSTFADVVMSRVVFNAVKPRSCATIQLNVHYVAPVKLYDFLVGRAEIVRASASMAFVRAQFNVGAQIVAMADGVWKIFEVRHRGAVSSTQAPGDGGG
jgi:uncharacterized protein (TIGR00369 family)